MCIINIYHLYYPQDQGEIKLNWDEGMHWTENHFQKTPWTHHDGMVQLLGMGKTCCNGKKTFIWHCTFVNKGNFLLHTPTQSRGFSRKDSEQDKVNFSSFLWSCRVTPSLAILVSENTKIPGQGSLECAIIKMFWSIHAAGRGEGWQTHQGASQSAHFKILSVKENSYKNCSETGKEGKTLYWQTMQTIWNVLHTFHFKKYKGQKCRMWACSDENEEGRKRVAGSRRNKFMTQNK